MKIKKINEFLFDKDITVIGNKDIDEDGELINDTFKGKGMSTSKLTRVFNNGKVNYIAETKIIINDVIPFEVYGGKVLIDNKELSIVNSNIDSNIYTILICK